MIYPGHAHEHWFGDEYWGRLDDANGMFEPWAERQPYKTLHAHLHQLLLKARRIVIIGYAFHDKIVNAELAAALDANQDAMCLSSIRVYRNTLSGRIQPIRSRTSNFSNSEGGFNFRGRALPSWRGGSAMSPLQTRWRSGSPPGDMLGRRTEAPGTF